MSAHLKTPIKTYEGMRAYHVHRDDPYVPHTQVIVENDKQEPLAWASVRNTTCCGLYEVFNFQAHAAYTELVDALRVYAKRYSMSGLLFVIRYFPEDFPEDGGALDQHNLVTYLRTLPEWNEPERWYRNVNTTNMLKACTLVNDTELYDEVYDDGNEEEF